MPTRSDIEFVKLAIEKGFFKADQGRAVLKRLGSAESNKAQMSLERVLAQEELLTAAQIEEVQTALGRKIMFCTCGQKTNIYRFKPGERVRCKKCGGAIDVPGKGKPRSPP